MQLLWRVFWRSTKNHRALLYWTIPFGILLAAAWVAEPLYAMWAIDKALTQAGQGESGVSYALLFGGWIGMYMLANGALAIVYYLRHMVTNRVLVETRHMYFERALALDIRSHVKSRSGEMMKVIDNAADSVVDLSRQLIFEIPTAGLASIAFFIIGFFVSWHLALLTIAIMPLYLLIAWLTVRNTRQSFKDINTYYVKAMGRGYDTMTNIFAVKSRAMEGAELGRMRDLHKKGVKEWDKANRILALLEGVNYFMLTRIVLVAMGVYLMTQGTITLGALFFFQFSFFRIIFPLQMLQQVLSFWNEKVDKIRLAEKLYATDIAIQNKEDAKTLDHVRGDITFNDVTFAYGDIDAVQGISLDVKAGEHIAFVGHSGAGKTTMAMLINRFYDVSSGAICVDGTDLRDLDLHWWRSNIGLVLQDNIMFNDSVLENIRYGRPEASKEDVMEAAKRAAADGFISNLADGYDTQIGERGIRLSGGERQRIAIARAILSNPSLVVLDEATSALDSKTEQEVQRGIDALTQGKTSFIIAHRLSTVKSMDRIAVLDNGILIACAPHQELLKTCPKYKEMVDLQSKGMLAE